MYTRSSSLSATIAKYRAPSSGPRIARRAALPLEELPDPAGLAAAIDYWDRFVAVAAAHRRVHALVEALVGDIPARADEFRDAARREYPHEFLSELPSSDERRGEATKVDVAIITVIREEYEAVRDLLSEEGQLTHWQGEVNLHAWVLGHVKAAHAVASYEVVLAMVGQAGNLNSKDAVRETLERFRPRFVLLTGIAGGLDRDGVRKGSLTISDLINGYEPGKIEGEDADGLYFQPRLTATFPVDNALRTAALALPSTAPDWYRAIETAAPVEAHQEPPHVVLGPVASGEKVIDDASQPFFLSVMRQFPKIVAVEMEGAGAASAIQQLREKQAEPCGFLMLRGISDMPQTASPRRGGETGIGERQRHERDAWKRHAAAVAASFAINMIRHTWPVPPRASEAV